MDYTNYLNKKESAIQNVNIFMIIHKFLVADIRNWNESRVYYAYNYGGLADVIQILKHTLNAFCE